MRTDLFSHSRHPFEVFILALCEASTLPTIAGVVPPPGTIMAFVPHVVAAAWAWVVFIGAGVALLSVFFKNRGTGLIMEQLGLAFTGLACIFYGLAVGYFTYPRGGLISAGIICGFGISCLVRCWQIQKYLDSIHSIAKKVRRRAH